MTDVDEIYGESAYLRATAFAEEPEEFEVEDVEVVDFESGPKVVLHLRDKGQLVLSRRNAQVMADLYGPRIEAWKGKRVWVSRISAWAGRDLVPMVKVWHQPMQPQPQRKEREKAAQAS